MSMKLLRLGLQFFAGGTKEEEDEVIIPGEEGVTGASGVTGSTTPAYTMPQNTVAAPKAQDFDTWYKANGGMDEAGYYAKYDLDPDRDYQNTVNTLNYDYQTSMATYGEQAEKLYQMGLQNSGVSDIFQANAFSSYLGNMNQAAANRITARKRNKAAFNDYVANMRAQHGQYESGINTEYDTKLNSALAFALDRYNGYNLDSVLSELGVAGYYTEVIQAVGDKLSGIDATSLKALKAQTENNLAQSILTAFPNLTEADKSAVETMFGGMVPDDALNAAFNRALTTYQNTDAGRTAAVNTFVTNWTDSFDPTMSKADFVNKMITKEDGTSDESQRANAEAAWEQMKSNWDAAAPERVQAIVDTFGIGEGKIDPSSFESKKAFIDEMVKNNHSAEDAEAAWNKFDEAAGKAYNEVWAKYQAVDDTGALINTYTGNAKQKLDIKNLLGADVPEYIYNEIIKRMDANRAEEKEADKQDTLTGIEDLPEDEVNYNTLYNEIQNSGNDPDIVGASSVKYKDAVMNAMDSPENLANAWQLVPNMSKNTWDGLDDAGKLDALLNSIGEAHKAGTMMDKEYYSVIESWIDNEIRASDDVSGFVSIVDKLKQYKNAGYLSEDYYNAFYRKMAAAISPDEFKIYPRATKVGPEYWFSFKSGDDSIRIKLIESKKKSSEFTNGIDIDGGRMYIDGGTLYLQYGNVVYTYGGLSKTKIDNKKTDSTVSEEIFRLISTAVSNSFITVSGSSENGGTKGKGDTQGGRTGEFAVANK